MRKNYRKYNKYYGYDPDEKMIMNIRNHGYRKDYLIYRYYPHRLDPRVVLDLSL